MRKADLKIGQLVLYKGQLHTVHGLRRYSPGKAYIYPGRVDPQRLAEWARLDQIKGDRDVDGTVIFVPGNSVPTDWLEPYSGD